MALFEATITDDDFTVTVRADEVRGEKLVYIVEEATSANLDGNPLSPDFARRLSAALATAAAA